MTREGWTVWMFLFLVSQNPWTSSVVPSTLSSFTLDVMVSLPLEKQESSLVELLSLL